MRITEITSENQTWLVLNNLKTDYFTDFNRANNILDLLINMKSPSRNRHYIHLVDEVISELSKFIETEFEKDADVDTLKAQVNDMIKQLLVKRSTLVF